ncbi:MFS transporter [Microbacterium forte]
MTYASTKDETRRTWWVSTVSGMASYLDAAAIVSTGTALVLYTDAMGLTPEQIGQLSALLTIMIAIGAAVGGRASDLLGRRRVFIATMIVYTVGAVVLAAAVSPIMLYIGLILLGFGVGADLPASLAMISESAPKGRKGRMVTYTHTLWILGILIVNGIGMIVGNMGEIGARVLYIHLVVVAVAVLILRSSLGESEEWQKSKTESVALNGGSSSNFSTMKELFRTRYVVPLIALSIFYALTNIGSNTNGQFSTYLYVEAAGSDVATASFWSFIAFLLNFAGVITMMRFVDTKWRVPAYIGGFLFKIVAFAIPALAGVSVPTLVLMAMLFSIGGSVSGEPLYKVWTQELFPARFRSTAVGFSTAFTRLVAAAVALVTPGIINGGPSTLFAFLVGTSLVSGCVAFFWIQRLPKAEGSATAEVDESDSAAARS